MSSDRVLIGLTALLLSSSVHAQDEVDHDAIKTAVEAAEPDAQAFALEVAKRAEAYAEEAARLSDEVMTRLATETFEASGANIDLGALAAAAPMIAAERIAPTAPGGLMVLVSFSMPEPSLKRLVLDAHQAGVPVLLRGFVGGSLTETATRMRALFGPEASEGAGPLGGVLIDPRAFRVFGVEAVPVFIATDAALPECDGLDCSGAPPAHDRIAGNMSLGAALQALDAEGTYGRGPIDKARTKLGRTP